MTKPHPPFSGSPAPSPAPQHLRVGITLHLREGFQSIWENGIFQNCAFLTQLFNRSPVVAEAVLVVNNPQPPTPSDALMLHDAGLRIIGTDEALQTLDVIIEMSAQLSEDWAKAFRLRGGRYAWMRVGNDYVIDIERAMFNLPHAGLCNDKVYDAIWTLPEYLNSCADYFAITTRAPVRIVPHLWTPYFFDKGIATLSPGVQFGYRPGRPRWRVCCFEPNVSMVKTGIIPLLGCEEAYRAQPAFLEKVNMCNTMHLKEQPVYLHMASTLDVVQHGLASFEARFAVYEFMALHGDCVISHHWENGQNYLYYEALYGDYPLVHNSTFIRDHGYYYPEFDTQAAGKALLKAHAEHDLSLPAHRAHTRELLRDLDISNPVNVDAYTQELLRLYAN
jgi:Protein of unknown function (DUF2827)